MASRYYSAVAQDTTLTSGITPSSTTMTVSGTTGYPSSYPFVLAIDYNTSTEELVTVTNVSGLTITISRAYNGTTAVAHNAGAVVRHVITAQDLTDAQNHYGTALSAGAHGVTGALATFLGTPTSANFGSLLSDETGTGPAVFSNTPTLVTPVLGAATATSINGTSIPSSATLVTQTTTSLPNVTSVNSTPIPPADTLATLTNLSDTLSNAFLTMGA
jgi:hypothetical protein